MDERTCDFKVCVFVILIRPILVVIGVGTLRVMGCALTSQASMSYLSAELYLAVPDYITEDTDPITISQGSPLLVVFNFSTRKSVEQELLIGNIFIIYD